MCHSYYYSWPCGHRDVLSMNPCNLFQDQSGEPLHLTSSHATTDQDLGPPDYPCPRCASRAGYLANVAANRALLRAEVDLERRTRGERETWTQSGARMGLMWGSVPNRIVDGRTSRVEQQPREISFHPSSSDQPPRQITGNGSNRETLSHFMLEHTARQEALRQLARPSIELQRREEQANMALVRDQERVIRRAETDLAALVQEQERAIQRAEEATRLAVLDAPTGPWVMRSSNPSPQASRLGSSEVQGGLSRGLQLPQGDDDGGSSWSEAESQVDTGG